ncbi:MAG: hypothetical protein HOP08_03615 [Cyclobacteriaceae bacterium]|nr:hypothetical protein [Cyclobacteriaceae bacterium]
MEEFLQPLRETAIYFKLTSKVKFGGAVDAQDLIRVLKSFNESYNAFIDIEYDKINRQNDKAKLKTIKSSLLEDNALLIVDLKFESCGMAISPNIVTQYNSIPQIKDLKSWKLEAFDDYKAIVSTDFNDRQFLTSMSKRFDPIQRQRIFKPIVEGIANNDKANVKLGSSFKKIDHKISKPEGINYAILIPDPVSSAEIKQEIRTSLAMVEIKGGRATPKVLELFEEITNPVYSFTTISFESRKYKFKYPLYCELIHEEGLYSLENKQFGIYAFGKNVDEARFKFSEEFDHIYSRYINLPDSKLSADVIEIKKALKLIVI